jgi:hypothetical protein
MGSKVKAVIGIAAAIFAPAIAGLIGATGIGLTLATAAISVVGASIAGSALSPDIPDLGDLSGADTYAGQKIQSSKNNTGTVPQVYGFHRLAGNIIYQKANAAYTTDDTAHGYNRDDWSIIVFAGHNIEDITSMHSALDVMTSLGSNKFSTTYVHVKWYDASSTPTSVHNVDFVTTAAGATQAGSTLGLTNVNIPADAAFMAVHQVFDGQQNKNTQLTTVTVEVEGKKIRTITNASTISTSTSYSNNPAEIILDLLGAGLNVPDSKIDIASFYDVKTKCAANGWTANLALIQQANIQSILEEILSTFRGQIIHSEDTWKLKVDSKNQTSVATFTADDIINNTLNITMRGSKDIFNRLRLKYINPTDEWLASQVVIEDTQLQGFEGQVIEKILDIKAVTNTAQANDLAEITLNTSRYSEADNGDRIKQTPLICNFSTTIKHAELEVGDVITIDHDLLDRVRKFMILSLETDQSGLIQVAAREYAETHYKDTSGNYLI